MKHIMCIICLFMLFSCQIKTETIGYKIERENFDGFYAIKLFNKNDVEVVTIHFGYDDKIISYTICETDRNFVMGANLLEENIHSYYIGDMDNYSITTNIMVDDIQNNVVLERTELINENKYHEVIYKNGTIDKKILDEEITIHD